MGAAIHGLKPPAVVVCIDFKVAQEAIKTRNGRAFDTHNRWRVSSGHAPVARLTAVKAVRLPVR